MYIPRASFAAAYAHLKAHAASTTSSVLILCALDTDSLCATRILTRLLKNDYIRHQIKPVSGYAELEKVNQSLVRGNEELRFIICLGLGGLVALENFLDLNGGGGGAVECWVLDGRRPWNLTNIYGGAPEGDEGALVRGGRVDRAGLGIGAVLGGIKCWDDGDIEDELDPERDAYKALMEMPDVDSDDDDSDSDGDSEREEEESEDDEDGGVGLNGVGPELSPEKNGRKRKSSEELEESDDEGSGRRRRRRREEDGDGDGDDDSEPSSGASTPLLHRHALLSHPASRPIPSSPPLNKLSLRSSPPPAPQASAATLRRRLRRMRRKHQSVLKEYYAQGSWYGEPISGLLYSLASDLGREDNDLLWLAIVGVCAGEIYGRTTTAGPPRRNGGGFGAASREEQIRGVLRDEVRRLNPPDLTAPASTSKALQTTARNPNDTAIRLSHEYRFMLIRHWSLYDAMLHSSFLGTKLHIWSDAGRKRLHKLLAKMGFSLAQCRQSYTHMDMDLKRALRDKIEKYAPLYGMEGIVKEGFTRCWGWRGCLSAADVGYVIGGMLEVGKAAPPPRHIDDDTAVPDASALEEKEVDEWIDNFWAAYDALENIDSLKSHLPTAMTLHRAILRTGTALLEKKQVRRLRSFRLAVVKEGPDLPIFTHPNALSKLALWLAEAVVEQERGKHYPLVLASLNERRGVYVIVGTALGAQLANDARIRRRAARRDKKAAAAGAKKSKAKGKGKAKDEDEEEEEEEEDEVKKEGESESDEEESDEEADHRGGRNRFGIAFQDVANSTQARIRIDSFEACVVECLKDDLAGFLEGLSLRTVMG